MAQHDNRHLTTEQLSALIDNQLSPQERAEYNTHLQVCQQCQKAMADLRQTVALLHALPQPALPRSFVLPVSQTAQPVPIPMARTQEQRRPHVHPIIATTRRTRRPRAGSIARQSVRVLSALAAVIGIVFFLSGFLVSVQHGNTTATSSSAGTTNGTTTRPGISGQTTPHVATSQGACGQPVPTPGPCSARTPSTATPGAGNGTPQVKSRTSQNQVHAPPIDLNSPQVHLGLGAVLLLIGVLGVVLTRKRRE